MLSLAVQFCGLEDLMCDRNTSYEATANVVATSFVIFKMSLNSSSVTRVSVKRLP